MGSKYKLSIIVVGRDDNYGGGEKSFDFIDRTFYTINKNYELFNKLIPGQFQYVFIDWSPINEKYIFDNPKLKKYTELDNFKNVIVSQEVINQRGLNPNIFYEYLAKNVGIKNSDGDYCLLTNPDDFFSEELSILTVEAINNNDSKKYYRPHTRIDIDGEFKTIGRGYCFGEPGNTNFFDYHLGGPAAGDFLLCKKDVLINEANGYYEKGLSNTHHQANLDGIILINLYLRGIEPTLLNADFSSFYHDKPQRHSTPMKLEFFNNIEDWGFLGHELKKINKNTFLI